MGGHVALAGGLHVLIGPAGAVAGGEAAGQVGDHLPVHGDVALFRGKARQQRGKGHAVPEAEHTAGGDGLAVFQGQGGKLAVLGVHLHRPLIHELHVGGELAGVLVQREVVHLLRQLGQELHLMLKALGVADDGDGLALIEEAVAGGAVADALAHQLRLAGEQTHGGDAGGEDDGIGLVELAAGGEGVVVAELDDGGHHPVLDGDAPLLALAAEHLVHLGAGDHGQAGIVGDALGLAYLVAESFAADPDKILLIGLQGQGGGHAGRARADNGCIVDHCRSPLDIRGGIMMRGWFYRDSIPQKDRSSRGGSVP